VRATQLHEREGAGGVAEQESGPVFLVGPARSGTSLLYKAVCLHPDTAYVSNWVARFPSAPGLARLNRLAARFPELRRRSWFGSDSNAYVYGTRRPLHVRLFPMPVEGEPVYAASGVPLIEGIVPEGTERQQDRLRSAFTKIREASGGTVFVNKRIGNNRRIPFLESAFPGARFVAIVRDGRSVALSLSKVDWWERSILPWYGASPAQWAAEGRDPWEACARNWVEDVNAMERGLRSLSQDRVLRLSYESFVEAPLDVLRRIAGFAGLRSRPEWDRALTGLVFPDRNEAWRSDLDSSAIATITGVQRETLEAHGYEP
jgi:Sulfotransferase family